MKLALILPQRPDLGWVEKFRSLALALPEAARSVGLKDFSLAVGVHMGPREDDVVAALDLSGYDQMVIRRYAWQVVPCDQAARMFQHISYDFSGLSCVHIPRDWGWNFCDCDAWIIAPELHLGAVMPLRPTFLFGRSIPERYDSTFARRHGLEAEINTQTESLLGWRQARGVFASHQRTLTDFVSYAGLWSHQCLEVGTAPAQRMDTELIRLYPDVENANGILCIIDSYNIAGLENLCRALRDLSNNQENLSITFAVDGFERGDGCEQRMQLKERLIAMGLLRRRAYSVKSFASRDDLESLVLSHKVVVSLDTIPGDPHHLVLAAAASRNFVGRRTPQSADLASELGLSPHWVDAFDVSALRAALSGALAANPSLVVQSTAPAKAYWPDLERLFERLEEASYVA